MKRFIYTLFFGFVFLSCSDKSKQKTKVSYHPDAIKMNNKGALCHAKAEFDSAMVYYSKAIQLDSTYYLPHSGKATIYLQKKEYDKAFYETKMAVNKKPDLAEAIFMLGVFNEQNGDTIKGKQYYLKSIEIFNERIKNSDDKEVIKGNKLNRALSKKFLNDETYLDDLNDIKDANYKRLIDMMKNHTKKEIRTQMLKMK